MMPQGTRTSLKNKLIHANHAYPRFEGSKILYVFHKESVLLGKITFPLKAVVTLILKKGQYILASEQKIFSTRIDRSQYWEGGSVPIASKCFPLRCCSRFKDLAAVIAY